MIHKFYYISDGIFQNVIVTLLLTRKQFSTRFILKNHPLFTPLVEIEWSGSFWGNKAEARRTEDHLYMVGSFFIEKSSAKRSSPWYGIASRATLSILQSRRVVAIFQALAARFYLTLIDFILTKLTGFSPLKRTADRPAGSFARHALC